MSDNIIVLSHITKRFPGIVANDDINIELRRGEIHALLGENGAGKSTLMSILFGLYEPDEGCIYFNDKLIKVKDPNDANHFGIGMVHQHFMLVDVFTGLENIILGYETTKGGWLQLKVCRERVLEIEKKYGLNVDVDKKVCDMTVGEQQRVEILKMLYRNNEVLIFDEPTAVLTPKEIEGLMDTIKNLKKEGKTIFFISHKLNEIREIADRVTILKKGKCVGTYDVDKSLTNEKMAELMVGHKVNFNLPKKDIVPGKEILSVKHLYVTNEISKKMAVKDFSFNVREGEIVSILGIDGNGQDELVFGLTGLRKISEGEILLNGNDISKLSIKKRNDLGIAHIPSDRHKYGLILDYNMMFNMIIERHKDKRYSKGGFLKKKNIAEYCDTLIDHYDIRSSQGSYTIVRSMSGGNQQKVIVAREIDRDTQLLVAVQPTRGLDVGAIQNIHEQLLKERENNKGILLFSLELDEVFGLADRIIVIHDGEDVGEFDPKKISYEEIGLYMSGGKRDTKPAKDIKTYRDSKIENNGKETK